MAEQLIDLYDYMIWSQSNTTVHVFDTDIITVEWDGDRESLCNNDKCYMLRQEGDYKIKTITT